jgi:hypothetical protein
MTNESGETERQQREDEEIGKIAEIPKIMGIVIGRKSQGKRKDRREQRKYSTRK